MSLKQFGKETLIYAIGTVVIRCSAFLLIPLYAHSLSLSEYGLLATLLATIQIMIMFTGSGMHTCLVRFTNEYEQKNVLHMLLGTTIFIMLLGSGLITFIATVFLESFFRSILHTHDVRVYILLAACASLLQVLTTHLMTYYRAKNMALRYMVASIGASLLLFVLSFIMLQVLRAGITGALAAYIASYAIVFVVVSVDVIARTGISVSFHLVPKLLAFGLPLVFSMVGHSVMGDAGTYFLSYYVSLEAVAVYSLGCKLAQILVITVGGPFQFAFQPYVFANLDDPGMKQRMSRLFTYLLLATLFMSLIIPLGTRVLLPLIAPPEYFSAYSVTLLLLPAMGFIGIYYYGETLLAAVNKTHIIGYTVALFAVLSVLLNYTLIPLLMDWHGAVFASIICYTLVGLTLWLIGVKTLSIPVEWNKVVASLLLTLSSLLIVCSVQNMSLISFCMITLSILGLNVMILLCAGYFDNNEMKAIKSLVLRMD